MKGNDQCGARDTHEAEEKYIYIYIYIYIYMKVKLKQAHYRPGVAQRVPGR